MVDIHCHLLYGVDDGAKTLEMSKQMLSDAAEQGVTDLIVTPHYRQGMFLYDPVAIQAAFDVAFEEAKKRRIRLYLGCEYHVDNDMIKNLQSGLCPTLAGSEYVLAEYSHASTFQQIRNSLEALLSAGYIPVIAHAERYDVFVKDVKLLRECRNMGAMVQINANSVLGKDGSSAKKPSRLILKENLASVVASDSHNMTDRCSRMEECRNYIAKEYGWNTAWELFASNPLLMISASRY